MLLHGKPTLRVSDLDPDCSCSPWAVFHDMGASGGTGGVLARLSQIVSDVGSECNQNTGASERVMGVDGATVVAVCSLFD
jgi:hypothetical protein